jgi:hypothetical protein
MCVTVLFIFLFTLAPRGALNSTLFPFKCQELGLLIPLFGYSI